MEVYRTELDEDGQVDFKGKAKGFVRSYAFLAQILPYEDVGWEKLSIFLNFLIPKLPAPVEEDLSKGILEVIDMDSYRVEKLCDRGDTSGGRGRRDRPRACVRRRIHTGTGDESRCRLFWRSSTVCGAQSSRTQTRWVSSLRGFLSRWGRRKPIRTPVSTRTRRTRGWSITARWMRL